MFTTSSRLKSLISDGTFKALMAGCAVDAGCPAALPAETVAATADELAATADELAATAPKPVFVRAAEAAGVAKPALVPLVADPIPGFASSFPWPVPLVSPGAELAGAPKVTPVEPAAPLATAGAPREKPAEATGSAVDAGADPKAPRESPMLGFFLASLGPEGLPTEASATAPPDRDGAEVASGVANVTTGPLEAAGATPNPLEAGAVLDDGAANPVEVAPNTLEAAAACELLAVLAGANENEAAATADLSDATVARANPVLAAGAFELGTPKSDGAAADWAGAAEVAGTENPRAGGADVVATVGAVFKEKPPDAASSVPPKDCCGEDAAVGAGAPKRFCAAVLALGNEKEVAGGTEAVDKGGRPKPLVAAGV